MKNKKIIIFDLFIQFQINFLAHQQLTQKHYLILFIITNLLNLLTLNKNHMQIAQSKNKKNIWQTISQKEEPQLVSNNRLAQIVTNNTQANENILYSICQSKKKIVCIVIIFIFTFAILITMIRWTMVTNYNDSSDQIKKQNQFIVKQKLSQLSQIQNVRTQKIRRQEQNINKEEVEKQLIPNHMSSNAEATQIDQKFVDQISSIQSQSLLNQQNLQFTQQTSISEQFLAIHTVFILQQNIPFLREWIEYHIQIGFSKFYLYDNSESQQYDWNAQYHYQDKKNSNKYGLQFSKLIGKASKQIQVEWKSIQQDYKQYLVVIKWSQKDQNQKVQYFQPKSILNYLINYSHLHQYTAFIDIDEFIFSQDNLDLKETIMKLREKGYSRMRMSQKKFMDRFCYQGKKATQIYDCIDVNTVNWSSKLILNNKLAGKQQQPLSIHDISTYKGGTYQFSMNQWRFNHYNSNSNGQRWMMDHYRATAFKKCYDESMNRYNQILNTKCKDKCSDKFFPIKHQSAQSQNKLCYNEALQLLNEQEYQQRYSNPTETQPGMIKGMYLQLQQIQFPSQLVSTNFNG